MFRIRSCTVYPIRMVYLSSSNRNVDLHVLHVHAIHVIHMLIPFYVVPFMRWGLFRKKICHLYFFTVFDMPRLSENERNQAIGMLAGGRSARVFAYRFGCCRKTIDRLAAWYQQTGLFTTCSDLVGLVLHYVDALT